MSPRSRNSPNITGEEAARTNANFNSDNGERGNSSRRARCRKSGRRAFKHRRDNESWAAKSKSNKNKLKHEDIVSMISRRTFDKKSSRVTEEDVKQWVESEEFEQRSVASMCILERQLEQTSVSKDYPAHGSISETRPDGTFRGMSVQLNGMVTSKVKNRKARLLTAAIRKYDVQFVGLGEVGVNWNMAKRKRLLSLLPELTSEARTMTAHNLNENVAIHQQGGVATLAMGEILNYYKKGARDFRRLGRWTSFTLQSVQGHRTRIVQGYGVRKVNSKVLGSVEQQHKRYIQNNQLGDINPRELFESDLLWQLTVWRALGDRIILK